MKKTKQTKLDLIFHSMGDFNVKQIFPLSRKQVSCIKQQLVESDVAAKHNWS